MNENGNKSELQVIVVTTVAGRRDRLAIVEHMAGRKPAVGMVFESPSVPGKWRITNIGLYQPDSSKPRRDRLPIAIENLTEGCEPREGLRLVES